MPSSPNPWWMPRAFGAIPTGVEPKTVRLLGMVALALLFEEYDAAMMISALKHIALELRIPEGDLSLYMALIRLGALPAFLLVPLSDRLGRRPVFLVSTVLLGLLTFATAFVQTPVQFVLLQALTRTFFVTGTAVAFVIVSEELPANSRGWGVGMLGALGSLGHGLGAALFSQIEHLPHGWRALYVIGVAPVLLLPLFLRHVPETDRFTAQHLLREPDATHAPVRELFARQPLRALGISLCGFLVAAAAMPSFQFSGYFTQAALGWRPGQYSIMVIAGGALGILGNVVAGKLGDRFGRKAVGFCMLAFFPLASFGFYYGRSTWIVAAAWIPLVFCFMGGRVILRAFSTELFATSHRGAAAGVFTVMEGLGAVAGLLIVHAFGTSGTDQIARVVSGIALLVLGTACILLFFPETRNSELDAPPAADPSEPAKPQLLARVDRA